MGTTGRRGTMICALLLCSALPALPASVQAQDEGDRREAIAVPELAPETPQALREELLSVAPLRSLPAALRRAYWSNPELLAQRDVVKGTDWRIPQARAGYGPKLSASASYAWQRDTIEATSGSMRAFSGWTATAQMVLTQPLMSFGRDNAAVRAATAQRAFQAHLLRSREQQVVLDVITAYVIALRDREGIDIARDNLTLLERELAASAERFRMREVTSSDLQQVETRVQFGRAQLLQAERAAAGSAAAFVQLTGATLDDAAAPPNPLLLPVSTLDEAYAFSERNNPVLWAAQAREQVSRALVASARADLAPRIDLRGSAEYGTVTPYSDALRQNEVRGEVVLTAPLFESGLRRARVAEAEALNSADWRLMDAALRENHNAIADSWSEWQAQSGSIDQLDAAVESARKAYDGAVLQERAGLRTTLDVLDLARELLSARTALNNAAAAATIGKARLLFAMGSLHYAWLLPDEARYDADLHLEKVRRRGDIPLMTPALNALDSVFSGSDDPRLPRDPAAQVKTTALNPSPGS